MTLTELKQISECRGTPLKESLIFKYTSDAKRIVNRLVNNKNHLFDYYKLWDDVENYIMKNENHINDQLDISYIIYRCIYKQITQNIRLGIMFPVHPYLKEYKASAPDECTKKEFLFFMEYLSLLKMREFEYFIQKYYLMNESMDMNPVLEKKLRKKQIKLCKQRKVEAFNVFSTAQIIKYFSKFPLHFINQIGSTVPVKKYINNMEKLR